VQQRLGEYLLAHLTVREGAASCEAIDQGYDIGRVDPLTVSAGLYGFEIFFQCPAPPSSVPSPGIVISEGALFDRLPGQVNFARVQVADGAFQPELFTHSHQQLLLTAQVAPAPVAWSRYVALGFARMLGRWDRWCFLLAATLLMRGYRDGWPLALGLTGGYALSLLATLAFGLVPRGELLGAALGALLAVTAAQLLAQQLERTRRASIATLVLLLAMAALALLAHARWPVLLLAGTALFGAGLLAARPGLARWRLEIVLLPGVFGFLDGFVLPEALAPQQLAPRALLPMTLGYDTGALLAGFAVLSALWLAREGLASWPQPALRSTPSGRASRALALDATTALLGGLGVFWMLSRLHG
jgi:hypothetical protein